MDDGNKTQLGKILLKRQLVNSSQLEQLLHEQQGGDGINERLATKVLEKGLTDEVKLLRALSEQAGVPAINLDEVEIPLSNLEIVPFEIARQHVILPVAMAGESISLAMANPDDQRVVDEIEFVSGKKIFPHVALHGQLVAIIEECYRLKGAGETCYRGKRSFESSVQQPVEDEVGPPTSETSGSTIISAELEAANNDLSLDIDVDIPASGQFLSQPPAQDAAAGMLGTVSETEIPDLDQQKILVVDDEDDIRLLISRVLTDKGFQVVTAGRGLEAIKKVQTENPDMIILDAMLPEVHGFDICKKIKGSKKYGHIPVIMISAIYRGWRYAQDLRDSYGVDDFVEKPFKIGEFIQKVEQHLRARNSEPPPSDAEDLSAQATKILAQSVEAYRAGNIDKAVELLRSGLKIDPLEYKLHYNLALLLGKKSLNYQAIQELESVLELQPGYFPALKNLALLYQKAGFKFKSIETWERALHYCPDDETRDGIKQHLMNLL